VAIQYADGVIYNNTFNATSRLAIVNALETALLAAGWTGVSGAGTANVLLASATTPTANNNIRVRLQDTGSGNCAQIKFENALGTKVSQAFFLLFAAGGKTYRVIANKYQAFVMTPGSSASREFVAWGVPYLPSFLHGVITGEFAWMTGNGTTDIDTTARNSLRTGLGCWVNQHQMQSFLLNGTLWNAASDNNNYAGALSLCVVQPHNSPQFTAPVVWHDDSQTICEPLIAWGLTAGTDPMKIRGQLWNAVVLGDAWAGDTSFSLDGRTFYTITNNNLGDTGTARHRGTLAVAVN
jgi:hypothetical protein